MKYGNLLPIIYLGVTPVLAASAYGDTPTPGTLKIRCSNEAGTVTAVYQPLKPQLDVTIETPRSKEGYTFIPSSSPFHEGETSIDVHHGDQTRYALSGLALNLNGHSHKAMMTRAGYRTSVQNIQLELLAPKYADASGYTVKSLKAHRHSHIEYDSGPHGPEDHTEQADYSALLGAACSVE